MFAFAHVVSRKTVDAIAYTLDSQGLAPRTHGNTGKSQKHALTVQDVQNIKHCLGAYGNKMDFLYQVDFQILGITQPNSPITFKLHIIISY